MRLRAMRSFLMIFVSVLTAAPGQVGLKQGMTQVGAPEIKNLRELLMVAQRAFSKPLVLAGLTCYAIGALAWLIVLSRLDLGFAYPMVALTYAIIPIAAHVFLGEEIPILLWVGIGIVIVGVLLIAQTGRVQ